MRLTFVLSVMLHGVLACALLPSTALAQDVELAAHAQYIRHDVRAYVLGASRRLSQGDAVARHEVVRTAIDSSALLRLRNGSLLSMGPLSQIALDDFVTGDDQSLTISIISGFFRILSGPKKPGEDRRYNVQTPHATIGVRGTTFDMDIEPGRTTIVLHDGAVQVCSVRKDCTDLKPGSGVEVTFNGLGQVRPSSSVGWNFWETQVPVGQRSALLAHLPRGAGSAELRLQPRSASAPTGSPRTLEGHASQQRLPLPMRVDSRTGWITTGP